MVVYGQTGHLNSFGVAGGLAWLEQGGESYLRFRLPWYSHSSSLLVSSLFRFSFLLCPLRGPDDDENDDDDDENDDENDDGAYGKDVNSDAGDAGRRSDWRSDEDGCQRGRSIAAG